MNLLLFILISESLLALMPVSIPSKVQFSILTLFAAPKSRIPHEPVLLGIFPLDDFFSESEVKEEFLPELV